MGHADVGRDEDVGAVLGHVLYDAVGIGRLHQPLADQRRTGRLHGLLPGVKPAVNVEQPVLIQLFQISQFHVFSSHG